jgi:hypothetical protein
LKIVNAVSSKRVPMWGNRKEYISIHYLGVVGQNHDLQAGGYGAHYYIYWDGTIYQRCSHEAIVWQVGPGSSYTQKHPKAGNKNTIGIEMCCKCDGDSSKASDPYWYFTSATQEACVELVKKLMKDLNIPAANVLRHYDIVNKICPAPYVHNNKYKTSWTWSEFKSRIEGSSGKYPAEPFLVRVSINNLNIRTGPGTNYGRVSYCPPGAYTIVELSNGPGASRWGRLKSDIGWIALDYTVVI